MTPDNTIMLRPVSPERTDAPLPVAPPELDPETLRSGLRDFLLELREAQRDRVMLSTITMINFVPLCSYPYSHGVDFTILLELKSL